MRGEEVPNRPKATRQNKGNKPSEGVKHFGVCYALSVKKNLPIIIIFSLIVLAALHRGGISFQAHLLWAIGLLPVALLILTQRGVKNRPIPTPLLGALLLFLLSVTAGWLTSTMPDFGFITVTTLFAGVTTLLIGSQIDTSGKNIDRLFTALSILASGLSVFGLILYISTPTDRLASTFAQLPYIVTSYPNAFALFLITLLPHTLLKFSGAFNEPLTISNKSRAVWFIMGATTLSSILLTFSRGGLIVATLMITTLIYRKRLSLKMPLLGLLLATALLASSAQILRSQHFKTNEFIEKATLRSDEKTASVDERVTFWAGSLAMIEERPLQGFGPDTFEFAFPFIYQKEPLANSEHPHNMFLKQAVDFGAPSAILYLAIIIGILVMSYLHHRRGEIDDMTTGLVVSLLGVIMHNFIDYNLNFTSNAILFWLTLGLIIGKCTQDKNGSQTPLSTTQTPPRITKSITIGLALMICMAGGYEIYQRGKIVTARTLAAEMRYGEVENIFAETHPLFYEDATILRGNNAIDAKNIAFADELLSEITEKNRLYAEAYSTWSEALIHGSKLDEAQRINQEAISLDGLNRLRYHLNFLRITELRHEKIDEPQLKNYITILEDYLSLLKVNAHNTVTTNNPSSAIKMSYMLEKATKSMEMKTEIINIRESLTATAIHERQKYFAMFNIPLSPL